ncbi:hypothetical protein N7495_002419 [Penicillium taxi]|uniref:uncharacterized protein n=1 Tax=Penicillium taxi TaxID=168475 RepID=UPI0025454209|nr:uncharacterized protein N7495_002419 [Penicillium taxi]KAJ5901891.1 hypothetical protein N7495_002419 [Penicillium taxi]
MQMNFAADKIPTHKAWPTIGRYLRKSTLRALSHCTAGSELEEQMIAGNIFSADDETEEAGYMMSKAIIDHSGHYDAIIKSIAQISIPDSEEDRE